ncbi:MAG: hypothetical protein ACE5IL_04585 [Myxococcota bacterium]
MRAGIAGRVAAALFALLALGFVLPAAKVIPELARLRAKAPPLRLRLELFIEDEATAREIRAEVHPDLGVRLWDGSGGRWWVREGELLSARGRAPQPNWVPDLGLLRLRAEPAIWRRLDRAGIDTDRNQLGRCGDADCFVIGGRQGSAQLWIDKDRFEIRRLVLATGRRVEFEDWRDWDGQRFPGSIRVRDARGGLATLEVREVTPDPALGPEGFSAGWVRESPVPPSAPGALGP